MKARKIVLLSLIAILLCVYIVQLVSTGKGSVKLVTMNGEPDKLILESAANGKIILTKTDDVWYLGENQQYETLSSEVDVLLNALKEYSILQTVSKGGDEILYGLDDESRISVTAYQGDQVICQIDVGKDASVTRQSYIRQSGKDDILLISDSYNSVFCVSQDDVRIRTVYTIDTEEITDAALVTTKAGAVLMSRDENGEWVGSYEQMTSEGIASWISTVAWLNAAGWLPDDWQPEGEPIGLITLKLKDRIVTDAIYAIEGEDDKYIGTSSECPYAFYMSSYTADKFLKTADDFAE